MKKETRDDRLLFALSAILIVGLAFLALAIFKVTAEVSAAAREYEIPATEDVSADELREAVGDERWTAEYVASLQIGRENEPNPADREDPLESEKIEAAILNKPDKPYPLSNAELDLVCRTIMAEAGGESYEEMMADAQCLMNGCIRNSCRPEAQIASFYTTPADTYTETVWCAVTAVLFEGETVTAENICWFYNPAVCGESAFHESQQYVMTIGETRYFAPEEDIK